MVRCVTAHARGALGAAALAVAAISCGCSRSSGGAPTSAPSATDAPLTAASSVPSPPASSTTVTLPAGPPGIGFDDMRFAASAKKILVPGGRSGMLYLVDPTTRAVEAVEGFSASKSHGGGHDFGVTSVDEGRGLLFATDRTARRLNVVSLERRAIVASAALGAEPDYVRFVAPRSELWVTEPDAEKIEVFSLPEGSSPTPAHLADIPVRGGPESLVVDAAHGRAYTHLWHGQTFAIDVATRAITARWPNGCEGSRGIEIDEHGAFVFVGCAEGKAVTLDAQTGRVVSQVETGSGVDVIAYASGPRRLFVPGAKSATLTVVSVSPAGELRAIRSMPTAAGAHCAASDSAGHVFVCDPSRGDLLAFDAH